MPANRDDSTITHPAADRLGRADGRTPDRSALRVVVFGAQSEPAVVRANHPMAIGRTPDCDIALNDERVSRVHARLVRRPGSRAFIEDLGARNGLFLNGEQIKTASIRAGDVIRLGDSVLCIDTATPSGSDPGWRIATASASLDRDLEKLARRSDPVLLSGPTGAGKTWHARQLANLRRSGAPFIHVNCAAIPSTLAETELFGSAKGAYTGASAERAGLFEAANGGVLFLDEVTSLPPDMQAKLLVVLDTHEIRRVGSTRATAVDVQVVAATNEDIHGAIAAGRFRRDLFFRLAACEVNIAPLSLRRCEIVAHAARLLGLDDHRAFDPGALEALLLWPWEGNLRELANFCASVPPGTTRITLDHLPTRMTDRVEDLRRASARRNSRRPTAAEITDALDLNDWNVSATARHMTVHRTQLQRWIEHYRIVRP